MTLRRAVVRSLFAVAAVAAVAGAAAADPNHQIAPNYLHFCTPALCPPDLAVREEVRSVWRWDPVAGKWYQASAQGFTVANIGTGAAGAFRISVLRSSNSYAIDVPSLAVGASQWYEVDLTCGEPVTIIVNPFNALPESNYNNNAVGFYGWCGL